MALAWEVGHAVIVALLLWVVAGAVLVGMAVVGVAVGVWRAGRAFSGSLAALRAWRDLRRAPGRYRPPVRPLWAAA